MTEQLPPSDGFGADGHLTDEALAILTDPRLAETETETETEAEADAGPPPAQREHLALCAPCRAAYEATERALVALRDPAALQEPPAELWDRIAAEISATPTHAENPRQAQHPAQTQTPTPTASVSDLDAHRDARETRGTTRRARRRSRLWIPLAAAAVGAILGGAAVAAVLGQPEVEEITPPVAGPTVVGDATLEPVAADDFTGRAEMVETDAGELELTVEISAAPDPEAGYFEVWLRDEDGTRLISLGAATADSTTFTVPAGIDLGEYPVVDVSHEHFDGDPGHSGTTLAAGPMEEADS